jgi:predicted DCC family thiol-disulfide oxidoreductase YuxK
MENLDNKIIVYDDVCPLCKAYTAGFVKMGWLEKRTGFTNAPPEMLAKIDLNRARHEIPLFDTETGETHYGLDALFLILGSKMPIFKPLFRNSIFRGILYQFYQIITFNRRLIAGSSAPTEGFDCAPDVNVFYRVFYICLMVFAGFFLGRPMLGWWATELGWIPKMALILHAILLFSIIFAKKRFDFMGHWATIFFVNMVLIRIFPVHFYLPILSFSWAIFMAIQRWKLVK